MVLPASARFGDAARRRFERHVPASIAYAPGVRLLSLPWATHISTDHHHKLGEFLL